MLQLVAAIAVDTNRLDVFGIANGGVSHKGWDGANWHPSATGWQWLGGEGVWQLGVASWDPGRLDLFTVGWGKPGEPDYVLRHKARTSSGWSPSTTGWVDRGGGLRNAPPAIAAWGPDRLDVFALASDYGMLHKAWTGSDWAPPNGWQPLGGEFESGPGVASWGSNRLDVFGLGKSLGLWHKAWMGTHWHPPNPSWQGLGGLFAELDQLELVAEPAVVSWGPGRLDVFGIGKSLGMWHKAWTGSSWYPSPTDWQPLGGKFRIASPAVVSWGPDRLDIFAIGDDYGMYHKAWMGNHWHPSTGWQPLGGEFGTAPAAVSWGPNRLDVFAVGGDEQMYQKTWDGSQWQPSVADWQPLGGQFVQMPF